VTVRAQVKQARLPLIDSSLRLALSLCVYISYSRSWSFDHPVPSQRWATNFTSRKTLANYTCHYLDDSSADFPFLDNRFDVAVLRFPKAMTESTPRHIIAECMRILCPQGFLEINCIDIDPKNMGSCTRKIIRALKEQMRTVQPNISLQPASNGIQSMLSHYGFENIHQCFIGLPCNRS